MGEGDNLKIRRGQGYVLGGGIAGLYSSFRLGIPLISKPLNLPRKYGPRYLHKRKVIGRLLSELRFRYKIKKLPIRYYFRNTLYSHPTPQMVEEYYKKCYNHSPGRVQEKLYKSTLSIFTTKFEDLESKLKSKVTIIPEEIKNIDLRKKLIITTEDTYNYDFLINTIPLPAFCSLTGIRYQNFKYKNLWIYEAPSNEKDGIVHFMDYQDPRTRINYIQGIAFEERLIPLNGRMSYTFIKYGKIIDKPGTVSKVIKYLMSCDVYLIGRFAKWKAHYDFEDVISDVEHLKIKLKDHFYLR